mmetsp:Transcript_9400/g.31025  ORF Transcript_9400/g.31025 Transcript_9400/m.31025 type:complete len:226 (-) Transcript_9400:1058-1735(-)
MLSLSAASASEPVPGTVIEASLSASGKPSRLDLSGTIHFVSSEGSAPALKNFCCEISIAPSLPGATFTTGNPVCFVQHSIRACTSFPLASDKAFQRSFVAAFPYACSSTYARIPVRNVSSPKYAASMRITHEPLEYEMASKISFTFWLSAISTSTGCEEARESSPSPLACSLIVNCDHTDQSGKSSWTARHPTQVAKPSLSHRSVHHCIVTRFPNHWCASSWHTT